MPLKPDESSEFKVPDRPLECSECKKSIAVRYTEVVGHSISHTSMCSDCPELQRRLHGSQFEEARKGPGGEGARIACGNCGTTLEAVRVGTSLGCSNCYEVFSDILVAELFSAEKLPARIVTNKKLSAIHIGRSPGEMPEISPSARLLALNEALNETLVREDYEQAAWLRDQIKALTDKREKPNEK